MPEIRNSSPDSSVKSTKNLYDIRSRLPLLPLPTAVIAAFLVCLLSSFSAVIMLNGVIVVALALSAVASAVFALLLILCRRVWVFAVVPVIISAVVIFCADSSGLSAALVFSQTFLAVGLVLAACIYLGKTCSYSIIAVSVTLAPWLLVCLILFIILSPDMYNFGLTIRENISNITSDLYNGTISSITSMTLTSYDGVEQTVFSHEAAVQIVNYISIMSPALIILSLMGTAFLSAKTLYGFFVLFGITDLLRDHKWMINPRKSTAVVYCISYLFAFLFSTAKGMDVLYFAAYNVSVIFSAPMAVCGFREILKKISKNASAKIKLAWVVLFIFIFIGSTSLFIAVAAFFGVFTTLKKKTRKNKTQ